jgi:hypothetical protein
MIGIYKIISPSNKIYIGQSINIEKRKINCKIAANMPGVQEKAVANTDWVSRNKKLKKPIIQLDLNSKFVKEWDSAKQIQLSNKGMWATDITRCCKGHQKTAYGFKWTYKL